jgi:outer membrane biosynthesis protein TonB
MFSRSNSYRRKSRNLKSGVDSVVLSAGLLVLGLSLSACSSSSSEFDPTDLIPTNLFGAGKKPLPGERRAVFPEGVPGVPQGVPPDLYKGRQATADQEAVAAAEAAPAPKPTAKPAPKPKAKPRTASTAQPRPAAASRQTQPADAQWPDPNPNTQQNAWPPPNPNTFSR